MNIVQEEIADFLKRQLVYLNKFYSIFKLIWSCLHLMQKSKELYHCKVEILLIKKKKSSMKNKYTLAMLFFLPFLSFFYLFANDIFC